MACILFVLSDGVARTVSGTGIKDVDGCQSMRSPTRPTTLTLLGVLLLLYYCSEVSEKKFDMWQVFGEKKSGDMIGSVKWCLGTFALGDEGLGACV